MAVDITIKNPTSGDVDSDSIELGASWSSSQGFLEVEDSDGNVVATYTPGYWLSVIKRDEE